MSLHQLTAPSSRLIPNAYLTQLLNGKVLKTMISVITMAAVNTEIDDFLQRLSKTVTNASTFQIKPVIRITGVRYVHNLDENLIFIRIVERVVRIIEFTRAAIQRYDPSSSS